MQATGVGLGVQGPALLTRGAEQATTILFDDKGLKKALGNVGQAAGSVTLIVQGLPSREQLLELQRGLERALAGVPVKEIYFAKGLGKLMLGGSQAKSMVGPEIANAISETRSLALEVDEVANTRIVATYNRARTVQVHALVLEPKMTKRNAKQAEQLGKYIATQMATFKFARASYQPGKLDRKKAIARANELNAQVLVESEILGDKKSSALALRVIDVSTGQPILRQQRVLDDDTDFKAAQALVAELETTLPEKLAAIEPKTKPIQTLELPTAKRDDK
jgi:hypothetical protein